MPRFTPYGYIRQVLDLFRVNDGVVVTETFTNPNAAVTNRFVTSTNMKVGQYTIANASAADGYPHRITCTVTKVDTNDTMGTIILTGTDATGAALTETITPNNGDTSSGLTTSTKCFKTLTSAEGVGWVKGGTTEDTIVIGFAAQLGLSRAVAADADVLTVYDASSLAATASFAGKGGGTVATSYFTPTGANSTLDYTAVYIPAQSTVLTGTTGVTLLTAAALGYHAEVEEFGFIVRDALTGTLATQDFTLTDQSDNVIATLTVAVADGAAGTTIKTTTITKAYEALGDADYLKLKRVASGTAFTAGSGQFYVRLRQKAQAQR